ncbi:MAG: ABC transporter ATP-binding protein [Sedimentibacter sp.]|uniref:energy-coupling factor ABC transporter ATP-binding protein n=1 Tax=Sedimentibacter sp. TaxID=1960295 RepID=UPI003158733C
MDKFIELKEISFSYKKGRNIFDGLSMTLDCKESTVITGSNGSGKTTLAKIIMGILKISSGEITIMRENAAHMSLGKTGELIGYVFQHPERQLFAASVFDELTFPLMIKGTAAAEASARAQEMLDLFELDKVRDSYPHFLSYGEKRRLAVAAVLMNKPKYIILDEPTASLDAKRIDTLSRVLKKLEDENIGMLIISHDREFTKRHGQRIIELEGGKILNDVRY